MGTARGGGCPLSRRPAPYPLGRLLMFRHRMGPFVEIVPCRMGQRQSDRQARVPKFGERQIALYQIKVLARHQLQILVDEMNDAAALQRGLEHVVALCFYLGKRENAVHDEVGTGMQNVGDVLLAT